MKSLVYKVAHIEFYSESKNQQNKKVINRNAIH